MTRIGTRPDDDFGVRDPARSAVSASAMTVNRDFSTIRWFGEGWGGPICDQSTHIGTPVGWICPQCQQHIEERDSGVTISHGGDPGPYMFKQDPEGWYVAPYHLFCFAVILGMRWD